MVRYVTDWTDEFFYFFVQALNPDNKKTAGSFTSTAVFNDIKISFIRMG